MLSSGTYGIILSIAGPLVILACCFAAVYFRHLVRGAKERIAAPAQEVRQSWVDADARPASEPIPDADNSEDIGGSAPIDATEVFVSEERETISTRRNTEPSMRRNTEPLTRVRIPYFLVCLGLNAQTLDDELNGAARVMMGCCGVGPDPESDRSPTEL